ncbi:MAG: gliding motility protein GldL [Bacteroidota bacterium]
MGNSFLESKGFKAFMAKAYGIGAAVVIVGALFKITHWKGADEMLILGLLTEAAIFFVSAFEPPHQEPDWTLVYPELAGLESKEPKKNKDTGSLSQKLDKMLEDAKVGPDLINSLGNGIRALNDNVGGLKDLSSAAVATENYTKSVSQAANSLNGVNTAFSKAVEAMNGIVSASEGSKDYGMQIERMTKNLSSLNSVYELEIAESNNHLKSINEFVGGLSKTVNTLSETNKNAEVFKVEMDKLSKNLSSLNNVYGNMLSAMTVRGNN